MTDQRDLLVIDVLDELRTLANQRVAVAEAQTRMRELVARHGDARVELVFEPNVYGDGVHYDAVIDEPDGGVVLTFCPDHGQPLVLRAADRLSDRDLVRVDGHVLLIRDAIALLDFVWNERPLMTRLIDVCIIEAMLAREPVQLSDADVQRALDTLRAANGLHSAVATQRWMDQRGITHDALERYAVDQASIVALRDRLVGHLVSDYFAAHRDDYDSAVYVRLPLPDDDRGRLFAEQMVAGEVDIFAATALWFDTAPNSVCTAPTVDAHIRRDVSALLREAIFERPNRQLQIAQESAELCLLQVVAVRRAELTEATRERVVDDLFEDWLTSRRAEARIEWNWGQVSRTRIG